MYHADNYNLTVKLVAALQVVYAFGTIFMICELGQRVNLAFSECNEMINQFEWYLFPYEIQRMLPTILSRAQQTVDIRCFGSISPGRETFQYVSSYQSFLVPVFP